MGSMEQLQLVCPSLNVIKAQKNAGEIMKKSLSRWMVAMEKHAHFLVNVCHTCTPFFCFSTLLSSSHCIRTAFLLSRVSLSIREAFHFVKTCRASLYRSITVHPLETLHVFTS